MCIRDRVWTAFALAFITMILLFFVKNKKKVMPGDDIEERSSSSVLLSENEKQGSILSPETKQPEVEAEPVVTQSN